MKTALFTYPDYGTPDSFPELTKRSGQNVWVIGKVDGLDDEVEPMYNIKFEDGLEHQAFESELTFNE
jgi:hypothetical protein